MGRMEAELALIMMAKSLADVFDRVSTSGAAVRQDSDLPPSARRALTLLSGLCLRSGFAEDLGASVHVAMDRACIPLRDWGLPQFAGGFKYADAILIDRDLGVPTDDCRELARQGGGEALALEEIHHEGLRAAVAGYPQRQRNGAYTALREFVVRNPATTYDAILTFLVEGEHMAAAKTVTDFYRPVPQGALFGSVARRCNACGSLLWPERDLSSYPFGRCRIRQCRLANPESTVGEDIPDPYNWRLATPAVLAYWVGPGLDEIAIYDKLNAAGRKVELYPQADAADVGGGRAGHRDRREVLC